MRIELCVFAVLYFINIGMVLSQPGLLSPKKCADFKLDPKEGFNKDLYVGNWFVYKLLDTPGTNPYKCYVLLSTPFPNGSYNVTEVLLQQGLPSLRSEGVSTFNENGKGIITYTSTEIPEYNGKYIVLETDYTFYTIEVLCTDLVGGGSVIQLYVLSRTPVVTQATQNQINADIAAAGLDPNTLRTLDINTCPDELIGGGGGGGLLGGVLKLVTDLVGGVLGLLG